jgi:hypothetical protein
MSRPCVWTVTAMAILLVIAGCHRPSRPPPPEGPQLAAQDAVWRDPALWRPRVTPAPDYAPAAAAGPAGYPSEPAR